MKPLSWLGRSVFRGNNKGSAFVQALVAVGVVGTMLYYLSPQVIKHRQQVTKTASIITARLALHSMVDFTLLGIKQRWCFSESWMPEPCAPGANASVLQILSHPRSVERILMKDDTIEYLRLMGVSNPDKVPLDRIYHRMQLKNFSAMHPVYKIIGDLKGYKVEAIEVEIMRDRRGVIPEYGREVYLTVSVKLIGADGATIKVGSSELKTTSRVGVYPREVGSFGLMVAGDLHLDMASGAGLKAGDAYIKRFPSRAERLRYPGLIFESPVFVNGSVFLPDTPPLNPGAPEGDTVYAPVTFKDKIILGQGPIMRKDPETGAISEFRPRTSGYESDQFWSNVRQFGGFQKGVEVDGDRDEGLDFLSGLRTEASTADPNMMQRCIEYNLSKYDLGRTFNSRVTGQLMDRNNNKFSYRMGLTDKNRFNPQTGEVDQPSVTRSGFLGEILKGWNLSKNVEAVARYTLYFGQMEITGEIPDDGQVTLEPEINLRPLKDRIKSQIQQADSALQYEKSRLNDMTREIEQIEGRLGELRAELRNEEEKKNPDKGRIASLQNRIENNEDRLRDARRARERQNQQVLEAEERLTSLNRQAAALASKDGVQPKIHISIKKPTDPRKPGDKESNPTFRDLEVSFENAELLINGNGDPQNINLKFEAYDVSYFQGTSLRTWSQQNQDNTKGWLMFTRNGFGFNSPQALTDRWGNSKGSLPDDDPYINYDERCSNSGFSAFGTAQWSQSFAPNSKHSWSFTNKYDDRANFVFNAGNAYKGVNTSTATFIIKSMAKDCIITSEANFVAGFMTCERLYIQARSTPLRIVGSFIVTNGVFIDDKAYEHGIRWSTIYHPMATYELRQAGILKAMDNQSCSTINRFPVWHPMPSMKDVANLYRCNAISLRSKADPFRWTAVDPDCGLLPNQPAKSTVCKNRLVRFYVLEVSRESGI
ncbi:hypothetical protein QJS83_00310 [Bdellovibrio sp. 22V]|uniref:hypothetical protein n=1 Tax=Bdellovibrio TaxID=958 RepID=UPI002542DC33|nr:hypothetical protein [Bdellovibrio sp. 22V]WII72308.1 hypothetical protein QJS83_00310 [Bdellovibrio sp. 22V]